VPLLHYNFIHKQIWCNHILYAQHAESKLWTWTVSTGYSLWETPCKFLAPLLA